MYCWQGTQTSLNYLWLQCTAIDEKLLAVFVIDAPHSDIASLILVQNREKIDAAKVASVMYTKWVAAVQEKGGFGAVTRDVTLIQWNKEKRLGSLERAVKCFVFLTKSYASNRFSKRISMSAGGESSYEWDVGALADAGMSTIRKNLIMADWASNKCKDCQH